MLVNYDGFRMDKHGERLVTIGECFDPVGHASSSLCHGRIGRAAWALFERGDGLVLAIDLPDQPLCVIPIDSHAEKMGFGEMAEGLFAEAEKRFR